MPISYVWKSVWAKHTSVLDKGSIKLGWDDPPTQVLLLWLSMNNVNNFWFCSVIVVCEFDIMVDRDGVKWQEGVAWQPMQCISIGLRIIELYDEVAQCVLKQIGTILSRNVTKWDGLEWGISSYFDPLSTQKWRLKRGQRMLTLVMILLSLLNQCHMLLHLLAALQPHCYLWVPILMVCCMISILCKVDVQVLRLFCVVIISGAKQSDRRHIMK